MDDAIPAIFPIGSIAKALLLGSAAILMAMRRATAIKNKIILGGSPEIMVDNNKKPPITV
jgi:hypothetical protein